MEEKNHIIKEEINKIYKKEHIYEEEWNVLFEKNEKEQYINLIVPATEHSDSINAIGKSLDQFSLDQGILIKKFAGYMYNKVLNTKVIDYKKIVSKELLNNYISDNSLKPLYLISPDFGGAIDDSNTVYVPVAIVELKNKIDEKLKEYLNSGYEVNFNCDLKYIGDSIIPSRIIINYNVSGLGKSTEDLLVWK